MQILIMVNTKLMIACAFLRYDNIDIIFNISIVKLKYKYITKIWK